MNEHELKLAAEVIAHRTGLSTHTIRELLIENWVFVETIDNVMWRKKCPVLSPKSARR